jgi:hypothetical protein
VIDDVRDVAKNVLGDNILSTLLSFVLSLLQVALTDVLFICFFASQELMDRSHIEKMTMTTAYSTASITFGVFCSKIVMNALLIAVVYYISASCVSVYEGHCASVIAIYFICAYEFLFNVLAVMAAILGLDQTDVQKA